MTIGDRLETGAFHSPIILYIGNLKFTDDVRRERALDGKELIEYLLYLNQDLPDLDNPQKRLNLFLQFTSSVDQYVCIVNISQDVGTVKIRMR